MTDRSSLSVVVLTFNEEAKLPDLLDSLGNLPREVYLVDSGSTDDTLEIAKSRGCRVVHHEWNGYSRQRNWAIENLDLEGEWELHLDADERLTPDLRKSILEVIQSDPVEDGYFLRKQGLFLGRPIRHGGVYPSFHLRLFRRGKARCEDRLYDQHYLVDGRVAQLPGTLLDVIASDLSEWTNRHNRWAEVEAREVLRDSTADQVEARLFGSPIERRRWYRTLYYRMPLFLRPYLYWLWRYVFRIGFLDGTEGLIFHTLHAFWYRFLVDARIYELRSHQDR